MLRTQGTKVSPAGSPRVSLCYPPPMVLRRLPSLIELRDDPSLTEKLTPPQLQSLIDQLREMTKGRIFGGLIPPSPAAMAQEFSEGEWRSARHLQMLDDAIVQLIEEQGKDFKILLVSMPPQHGKSELVSHWTPPWFLSKYPRKRVILATYGDDFAATWGFKSREVINKHGEKVGIALDRRSTAANEWTLVSGGGMKTVGAGSGLAGRPAELFIIDDPHKEAADARSEHMQEKIWDWFTTVAYPRLQPSGVMIVISTRWHETDLYGRIKAISKDPDSHFYGKVAELRLPAEAEADDPLGREVGGWLWPEHYSEDDYLDRKALNKGYNWAAVYQQRPSPDTGNRILREWLQYYQLAPAGLEFMLQSWDFSLKDQKRNDPVVGQVWGFKGVDAYLLDQVRGRMDITKSVQAVRDMTKKWPATWLKLIEDKANGPAVIQTLRHEIAGLTSWPPKGQRMTDKEQRLDAVAPLFSGRNIWFPDGSIAPWIHDYVEELVGFPNAANDDQVDATTQALDYVKQRIWQNMSAEERNALKAPPPKSTMEIYEQEMWKVHQKRLERGVAQITQGRLGTAFQGRGNRNW